MSETSTGSATSAAAASGTPSEAAQAQPGQTAASQQKGQPGQAQASGQVAEDKSKEAAKQAAKLERFKYVVDGQEVEEEIDMNNRDEIAKRLRLSAAATKRMTEAKQAQAKAMQIIQAFEQNPEEMLKRLGPKGKELAERYLLQSIQEEMMDPKEKEFRSIKAENDGFKKKQADEQKQREQQLQQQQETKIAQDFQKTIIDAAEKSGLPKSPALIRRMAKILHTNVDLGLDLSAHDLALEVKKDLLSEIKAIIGDSEGSHLVELFGQDVAKKIRKFDLQRLQDSQQQLTGKRNNPPPAGAPAAKPNQYQTPEQWKEETARRVGQIK